MLRKPTTSYSNITTWKTNRKINVKIKKSNKSKKKLIKKKLKNNYLKKNKKV